jgi:hypothetical protein
MSRKTIAVDPQRLIVITSELPSIPDSKMMAEVREFAKLPMPERGSRAHALWLVDQWMLKCLEAERAHCLNAMMNAAAPIAPPIPARKRKRS